MDIRKGFNTKIKQLGSFFLGKNSLRVCFIYIYFKQRVDRIICLQQEEARLHMRAA